MELKETSKKQYNCLNSRIFIENLNQEISKKDIWITFQVDKNLGKKNGGERGIRTLGGVAPSPHFQCGAFDHSTISPMFYLI